MQIEFYTKHVYGIAREYPATAEMSRIYQALTGEKTLRTTAKWALAALGHTFVEVLPPKTEEPIQLQFRNPTLYA